MLPTLVRTVSAVWLALASVGTAPASGADPVPTEHPRLRPAGSPQPLADVPLGRLPPEIEAATRAVAGRPLAERITVISALLLDRPYALDPLGEGSEADPDPLARYDTFDCLTFTEEVLALALAGDPAHAGELRLAFRYEDGEPRYERRRHFMELQWIPANLEAGLLKDTTGDYGPTFRMEREVTLETWKRWPARPSFQIPDDELPIGLMALDVLSLDDARAAAARIRPGSLLLTVRADQPNKPLWVSHVGLVIEAEQPTVRHATKMGAGKVRDHSLEWYLHHLETYKVWPAVGVAVLEPVEAGPRLTPPRAR
ncbi:MAG: DUF1460 domain-containing protein [Deltaproteobacteria bacterium]|nr:MAG: DUF1460 domain-containing protein [Deltaproteobacteria bacterium]